MVDTMPELFDAEVISIIGLTLRMTLLSTSISALIGIPLGLWLDHVSFFGKRFVIIVNRALMGSPPVVVGLVVYLIFMRNGPLGFLGLLFTFEAMVIAQVILITPIICGIVHTASERNSARIRIFAQTMGANKVQTQFLLVKELSNEIYFAIVGGFGRAMSEVGAIMIVGGNIRHHTRTMTTSISLLRNRGEINQAIVLGAMLMLIAIGVQVLLGLIRKKERRVDENF